MTAQICCYYQCLIIVFSGFKGSAANTGMRKLFCSSEIGWLDLLPALHLLLVCPVWLSILNCHVANYFCACDIFVSVLLIVQLS